jgi:hypothetical protein
MLQRVKAIHYSLHEAIIVISDAVDLLRNTCCVLSVSVPRFVKSC